MIAARCCGAAERLIEIAREFALEREAFDRPIAEYQEYNFHWRTRSPSFWPRA